jgi:ribA/ribD-fused uncharacterized protein
MIFRNNNMINIKMDKCSYFITNKALFGSYPTQKAVEDLENLGVRYFIDLTCDGEKNIIRYHTKYDYIRYPIKDHSIPVNWKTFASFVLKICAIIKKLDSEANERIFISCRGGHGRSGIVVASILCYLYKIMPVEALRLTNKYHGDRKEMRDKWRRLGSPQGAYQHNFVRRFFRPIYFYGTYNTGFTYGFNIYSINSVEIENMGTFPTAEAAFQAFKNPDNKEYIKKQQNAYSPLISRKIGHTCQLREDWNEVKDNIMYKILDAKFHQHDDLRNNLLNTGLGQIVEHGHDIYWSDGKNSRGKNMLGKILVKLRNRMYTKEC